MGVIIYISFNIYILLHILVNIAYKTCCKIWKNITKLDIISLINDNIRYYFVSVSTTIQPKSKSILGKTLVKNRFKNVYLFIIKMWKIRSVLLFVLVYLFVSFAFYGDSWLSIKLYFSVFQNRHGFALGVFININFLKEYVK